MQPVANIGGGGNQNADIQFIINGPDLVKLDTYSKQLVARVRQMKGVVDVDTSLNAGKPEVSVRVDRPKAADLGVQIADAAEALRLLVGGDQVTTYNEGGEQYQVHLRAKAANRSTQEAVASLTVPSARLGTVSLDNVATFSRGSAPSDINRLRRQRQVTVFANLLPGGVAGRSAERDGSRVQEPERRAGISRRPHGPVARARPRGAELHPRLRRCR